jgi:Chaperone of endosialidase
MHRLIQFKTTTLPTLLTAQAALCFALLPTARAVAPAPDGGYPGFNTAEGQNALFSLTTGIWNTAIGAYSLSNDTTGNNNTAVGTNALRFSTTGNFNTATGVAALEFNTTGNTNTADGVEALAHNTTGDANTAIGFEALWFNTTGFLNTAVGWQALALNTTGTENTAAGFLALSGNSTGIDNTAIGKEALGENTTGSANTACGKEALLFNLTGKFNTAVGFQAAGSSNTSFNTAVGYQALNFASGLFNTALGYQAGKNLTTGSGNIYIGSYGFATESGAIRLGFPETPFYTATYIDGIFGRFASGGTAVFINSAGKLGTVSSSRRFKNEIKPMDKASEAILALKPVTFHYKSDNTGTPQFGLIAEEVAAVNPDLVVHDENGEIYTVRYDAVNAMLLNEFLKQHQKVERLEAALAAVNERLKEQDAKIDKVNAKVELTQPAPQVVNNGQ